jgi:hypothetical protein
MKITIQKAEEQKPESKYPYFGISDEGQIVLFTSEQKGVLVVPHDKSSFKAGYSCGSWVEENFEPFYGTIKIEQ